MMLLDVNVLVYAFRADTPHHKECHSLLDNLANGNKAFGVPEIVFSGFIRVVTLPPWRPPSPLRSAIAFCDAVRSAAAFQNVVPRPTHWSTFTALCDACGARGNLVADAYLATFALERDEEWVTADRDFSRFPGLTWRRPWDAQATTNPR